MTIMRKRKQTSPPAEASREPKESPQSLQRKIVEGRTALVASLGERDEEFDILLTALFCKQHALFVGPPGVAKSLMVRNLALWFNGAPSDYFEYLLTRFTEPAELFGQYSMKQLREADKYTRLTQGKLPTARFAFLDEYANASSAIANTLLVCMNERMYDNGEGPKPIPLLTLVGATNRWPEGEEVNAGFDRFLFRSNVHEVSDGCMKQLAGRKLAGDKFKPAFTSHLTYAELEQAQKEASGLTISGEAKIAWWKIRTQLKEQGIFPGDRRMLASLDVIQASAYLAGAAEVRKEHLQILKHVLWNDPAEGPRKCEEVVLKIASPLNVKLLDIRKQADDICGKALKQLETTINEADKNGIKEGVLNKLSALLDNDLEVLDKSNPAYGRAVDHLQMLVSEWNRRRINAPVEE